jgi:hypothetical protein
VGFGVTSVLGALLVPSFARSFLTKNILTNTATSVGTGILADLVFPDLLQSPTDKYDNADLPAGYQLQKAAFELSTGFGIDKGAKLAQGFDDLLTAGGRKLGELLDGVPVLVDGFENFAKNPTSLGDLFQPGIQTANAAINKAGSWFQHYFASDTSGGSGTGATSSTSNIRVYQDIDLSAIDPIYVADSRLIVDMPFVGKGASKTNAAGWLRDLNYYWDEILQRHPGAFSQRNLDILEGKVQVTNTDGSIKIINSPVNDGAFRNYFPQYDVTGSRGQSLIHHHVGGGGQAFAVPANIHPGSGGIHNIEKDLGIWGKDTSYSELLQGFIDNGY